MSKGMMSVMVLVAVIGLVVVAAAGLLLAKYSLKSPAYTTSTQPTPYTTTRGTPYPSTSPSGNTANMYSNTSIDSDINGIDTKMKSLDTDSTNVQNSMNDKSLITE